MTHIKRYIRPPCKNTWKTLHFMPNLSEILGAMEPEELILKPLRAPGSLTFWRHTPHHSEPQNVPPDPITHKHFLTNTCPGFKRIHTIWGFMKNELFTVFL